MPGRAPKPHRPPPHGSRCEWAEVHRPAAGQRVLGNDFDCLVQVGALDQVEAHHLLLRIGEGAVRDRELAVAHSDGGGVLRPRHGRPDKAHSAAVISSTHGSTSASSGRTLIDGSTQTSIKYFVGSS